ncbi:MAG: Bro-N domain-containing protein [Chlamydiae bacterium]|nr:Bro-N domain-containing protein [Chlamydiota bacterium]
MSDIQELEEKKGKIVVFDDKKIRRIFYNNEWWFVVKDIIETLIDTSNSTDYIKKMRLRDRALSEGWGQIVTPLSVNTLGGRQNLNCANTEGIFRIIQSIPSPKIEPFKRWLAKVGYERIQEIEDPELATKRTRSIYKAKGYSDDWIEKRMRGIAIREGLTDEWEKRGIKLQREYAILTAEISKATFGITPSEYKKFKNLQKENLRDHMTDLELIFSMLGEAATREISVNKNAKGFTENSAAAKAGGKIAGEARRKLETESGKPVISKENFNDKKISIDHLDITTHIELFPEKESE